MTKKLLLLAFTLGSATSLLPAQDGQRPPDHDAPRMHLLPRGAEETLNLTDEQRKRLTDLEADVKTKIESILTPAQVEKMKGMRPPARDGQGNPGPKPAAAEAAPAAPAAARPALEEASAAPAKPLPAGVTRVPVVLSGGHETVPVDHGRPVKLIAAALGVEDEVFREAFSHVHPAGPGSGGPTETEARANKAALMNALGKLGISNDRLNTVSNFYRYAAWEGGIWKNKPATANALVKDGVIVGYEITSGGYGYTTPPTVTTPGVKGAPAKAELSFGKDFETNGAVSAITPVQGGVASSSN